MKNTVIIFLTVLLLGISAEAWRQYEELKLLHAGRFGSAGSFDQLTASRRHSTQIESRSHTVASQSVRRSDTLVKSEANAFAQSSNDIDTATHKRILANLPQQYAALWKRLGLNPDQIQKFEGIILERALIGNDVAQSFKDQGIDRNANPEAFGQAVRAATAASDSEIQADFGSSALADFQQYEQTIQQRTTVNNSLQPYLTKMAIPLTDDQSEQLVQIMAQFPSQQKGTLNDQTLGAAATVLSPQQYQALQNFSQLQQTMLQLQSKFYQIQQQMLNPAGRPNG